MIKLSDGELLDLLPSQLKNDTDMICLSYALKLSVDELLEYETHTMTQNFVELLPERILDVMAVELRSPYYRQDMDIDVKRGIIKNTLIWHTKAGTSSAVAEMISVLFGEGEVVEWYDFDEGEKTPGMFDIVTNARMTEDIVEFFMQVIERVKNERSHLRRVLIERDINVLPRVGSGAITTGQTKITNNQSDKEESSLLSEYIAAGAISFPGIVISNSPGEYADSFIAAAEHTGTGSAVYPNIVITNMKAESEEHINAKAHGGVGSVSSAHLTITNHPRDETDEGMAQLSSTVGAVSYPRTIIN